MAIFAKKRRLIVSFAVLALVGIGLFFLFSSRKPELRFETAQLSKGPITAKVTATGTLSALVTVQVGSQVSGRIQQLFVDFNSLVKKGQVIATIDPQLFNAACEQARANRLAAQSNFEKAKVQALEAERQRERAQRLAERSLIAQADLESAQANAEAAKAQVDAARAVVEQSRAALNQAEVNLAFTTIVSPIDGVVISRNVDVGQTVAASFQAPTLFVIAEDLRKMQVNTSVAEADVGKLKPQMPATFTVDAYPEHPFTGTVRQIRNAPQSVQNVVTYDAVLDVENPDLLLKPGMTANVTFTWAEKAEVLRVPNAALRFRPGPELQAQLSPGEETRPIAAKAPDREGPPGGADAGRARTIWVMRESKPEPVSIRVGLSDGTLTEVLSGELRPGDTVVTDATGAKGGAGSGRPGGPGSGGGGRQPFRPF